MAKERCLCGCGKKVSVRTELRHRKAQALAAQAQAARSQSRSVRRLAKSVKKGIKKSVSSSVRRAAKLLHSAVSTFSRRSVSPGLVDDILPLMGDPPPAPDHDFEMAAVMDIDNEEFERPVGDSRPPLAHWNPARHSNQLNSEDEEDDASQPDTTSTSSFSDEEEDDPGLLDDEIEAELEKQWTELGMFIK